MEIRAHHRRQLEVPLDERPQVEARPATLSRVPGRDVRGSRERPGIDEGFRIRKDPGELHILEQGPEVAGWIVQRSGGGLNCRRGGNPTSRAARDRQDEDGNEPPDESEWSVHRRFLPGTESFTTRRGAAQRSGRRN